MNPALGGPGVCEGDGLEILRKVAALPIISPEQLTPIRKIGEGSFATVVLEWYQPSDNKPRMRVAVKRIKPELLANEHELALFVKEVNTLKSLSHKYIVRLIGVGSHQGGAPARVQLPASSPNGHSSDLLEDSPFACFDAAAAADSTPQPIPLYLLQEYCAGGPLSALVGKQMVSPWGKPLYKQDDAVRWAMQIAEALTYLHDHNPMIIHRDLKLSNVLLDSTDIASARARVADFGLHASVPRKELLRSPTLRSLIEGAASLHLPLTGSLGLQLSQQLLPGRDSLPLPRPLSRKQQQLQLRSVRSFSHVDPADAAAPQLKDLHKEWQASFKAAATKERRFTRELRNGLSHLVLEPDDSGAEPCNGDGAGGGIASPSSAPGAPGAGVAGGVGSTRLLGGGGGSGRRGGERLSAMDAIEVLTANSGGTVRRGASFGGAAGSGAGSRAASPTSVGYSDCSTALMQLTGRTGSLVYMAPEVFKAEPYNQKADVFSFGVMLYELLHRQLLQVTVTVATGADGLPTYAASVAYEGYRPAISAKLDPRLASLISDCWAQQPAARPGMAEVVSRLAAAHAGLSEAGARSAGSRVSLWSRSSVRSAGSTEAGGASGGGGGASGSSPARGSASGLASLASGEVCQAGSRDGQAQGGGGCGCVIS